MLAVPNGSCFCLLNSQLTAIPWGLLINGDFLGLDGWTIWISHGSGLKRLCICQGGTLPSSHLWYVLWGKVDTNGGYPSFDTSPEKAWYVEPLGFFFRFSLLTIAIRAVSTLNQIWAAKCLTCSSLLLAAKFRCFWVTAHVAACSCLLNFTFLVVSSPCVEFYAGWWFGTFFFSIYWECHNPSWLFIFFRGVGIPPTSMLIENWEHWVAGRSGSSMAIPRFMQRSPRCPGPGRRDGVLGLWHVTHKVKASSTPRKKKQKSHSRRKRRLFFATWGTRWTKSSESLSSAIVAGVSSSDKSWPRW